MKNAFVADVFAALGDPAGSTRPYETIPSTYAPASVVLKLYVKTPVDETAAALRNDETPPAVGAT